MTFSKSYSCGNSLQQVYTLKQSCKFTYIQLQATIQLATYQSLISYLKIFWLVYKLAVWIKMLYMTFSKSHSCGNSVQQVYTLQQSCKLTYIQLQATIQLATYQSLINYLKILLVGVRTSRLDQNATQYIIIHLQLQVADQIKYVT